MHTLVGTIRQYYSLKFSWARAPIHARRFRISRMLRRNLSWALRSCKRRQQCGIQSVARRVQSTWASCELQTCGMTFAETCENYVVRTSWTMLYVMSSDMFNLKAWLTLQSKDLNGTKISMVAVVSDLDWQSSVGKKTSKTFGKCRVVKIFTTILQRIFTPLKILDKNFENKVHKEAEIKKPRGRAMQSGPHNAGLTGWSLKKTFAHT